MLEVCKDVDIFKRHSTLIWHFNQLSCLRFCPSTSFILIFCADGNFYFVCLLFLFLCIFTFYVVFVFFAGFVIGVFAVKPVP